MSRGTSAAARAYRAVLALRRRGRYCENEATRHRSVLWELLEERWAYIA